MSRIFIMKLGKRRSNENEKRRLYICFKTEFVLSKRNVSIESTLVNAPSKSPVETEAQVLYAIRGAVATVTLNRPERRNALPR